jgi:hypothetical protein
VSLVSSVVLHLADSASPSPSLSQSTPTSPLPGENDSSWIGPGLLGFLSLLFLAIAVFFIYRGLDKQLKRVTFDETAVNDEPVAESGVAGTDGAAADGAVLTLEGDTPTSTD